jgi:ribosomal protein S18 acetylase RimI-like enzyme
LSKFSGIHIVSLSVISNTESKRGCIGKIIFTLEKDGKSAHVKSLAINKEWRGCGLAKILYLACLSTLKELKVEELHLEAEEDSRRYVFDVGRSCCERCLDLVNMYWYRHGKLVGMYENWGFEEKKDSKVLLLYNNNECFRKVPMMLSFYVRYKSDFFRIYIYIYCRFIILYLLTSHIYL